MFGIRGREEAGFDEGGHCDIWRSSETLINLKITGLRHRSRYRHNLKQRRKKAHSEAEFASNWDHM